MPSFDSTLYADQLASELSLHVRPSAKLQQCPVRMFRVSYTLAGTEAAADVINLGFPKLSNGYVIPEMSRVTDTGGGGDTDCDFTLQKVNTAGTAVALTAAASVDNNSVPFARPSTPVVAPFTDTDYLRVLLSSTDAVVAGGVLLFEIAYYSENAS